MDPKQKARDFLARYRQLPEDVDLNKCLEGMLQEMKQGLEGSQSSLMMIPTYLSANEQLKTAIEASYLALSGKPNPYEIK